MDQVSHRLLRVAGTMQPWRLALFLWCAAFRLCADPLEAYVRSRVHPELIHRLGWQQDLAKRLQTIRRTNHAFEIFVGTAGITREFQKKGWVAHAFEMKLDKTQDSVLILMCLKPSCRQALVMKTTQSNKPIHGAVCVASCSGGDSQALPLSFGLES